MIYRPSDKLSLNTEHFFYFRRGDSLDSSGTIFSLKYANSTKTLGKTKLYLYYITDNSIPYCQKRVLYTNNSPELIYHIIHNERSSRFFRNIFMDSLRVGDALRTKSGKKRKSNHTFILEDVDDELEFGNGYIGGIRFPKINWLYGGDNALTASGLDKHLETNTDYIKYLELIQM